MADVKEYNKTPSFHISKKTPISRKTIRLVDYNVFTKTFTKSKSRGNKGEQKFEKDICANHNYLSDRREFDKRSEKIP